MKRTVCSLLLCGLLLPASLQAAPYDDGHVPADHLMVVDGILVANKNHPLGPDYNPLPEVPLYDNTHLLPAAQTAFDEMAAAAKSEAGADLFVLSGFRSYTLQVSLFNSYSARSGGDAANKYSARAGFSEHQTGLACDIGDRKYPGLTLEKSFANTPAGKWLADNSWRFGFVLRYMKDKENITGYQYEPWHFRYVGRDLSKEIYDHQTTLEEWLGLDGALGRSVATREVSTIDVNEQSASISGIFSDDLHYYKLRDLAQLLAHTPSAFTVAYHEDTRTIQLSRQKPSGESEKGSSAKSGSDTDTPRPAESKEILDEKTPEAATDPSDSAPNIEKERRTVIPVEMPILLDGQTLHPAAWQLDGTTYVKLRDLAPFLDYIVTWNAQTGIQIESLKPLNLNLLNGPGIRATDAPSIKLARHNESNEEREAQNG